MALVVLPRMRSLLGSSTDPSEPVLPFSVCFYALQTIGLPFQPGLLSQGVDLGGVGRKLWEAPGGIFNHLRGAKGPSGFGSGKTEWGNVCRIYNNQFGPVGSCSQLNGISLPIIVHC